MYLIKRPKVEEVSSIEETLLSLAKSMKMPVSTSAHLIFDCWSEFVGEYLAKLSSPLSVSDSVLTVAASNAGVAKELKLNGDLIINLINDFLKMQVVTKIEVKTGPIYARRFRHSG